MDAYLIDAVRTPFGKFRGGLSTVRTDDLAALPIAELMARNTGVDPSDVDDVLLGDANGAGEDNRNVARMAALLAGLPVTVPGVTINRLCASGGEALVQGARAVSTGDARYVVAGGVESMSRAPFVIPKPDEALPRAMEMYPTHLGWRMVNPEFPDEWTRSLGACSESVADELGVDRVAQDEWALRSHQLAAAAWDKGLHAPHVMEVNGIRRDESIRADTSMAKLASLKSSFSPDGAVTAGNSSPINDGAAAVLIGPRTQGSLGRIIGSATVGIAPERFSVAPADAIRKLLARLDLSFGDIHAWEINEAFAAMVLSNLKLLPELDPAKVNVDGGAIAYGHPLGASAVRVIIDLCAQLRRRGGGYGIAAACIGVGQGIAVAVHVD
ncbi:thiolase family protein [Phytomonospora endophytica]|uniref:Probable acetyl-CoA acetyltransferase n=1 Tax=Phytomonospora endophytica TaxID=714109 RepID=A0A841FSG5_9ACTN|nr:thiolase family protein [Phytomonospora endophytica]MBB6038986.1 acetyl-CoA acyltransferase [Phytomonospora endophytica]GIG67910.1 acetyl-CoA acetyltransferase [Phytomonospora endophytica]